MNIFDGRRICGSTLDVGFLDQQRPNLQGECGYGFKACNPSGSPDNIVCMREQAEEAEFERRCPIIDLVIEKKTDVANWKNLVLNRVIKKLAADPVVEDPAVEDLVVEQNEGENQDEDDGNNIGGFDQTDTTEKDETTGDQEQSRDE